MKPKEQNVLLSGDDLEKSRQISWEKEAEELYKTCKKNNVPSFHDITVRPACCNTSTHVCTSAHASVLFLHKNRSALTDVFDSVSLTHEIDVSQHRGDIAVAEKATRPLGAASPCQNLYHLCEEDVGDATLPSPRLCERRGLA